GRDQAALQGQGLGGPGAAPPAGTEALPDQGHRRAGPARGTRADRQRARRASGDEDAPAVADSLGMVDEALEGVEYRESLKPLLEQLPPREKKILLLRFFGNMTQSQIAIELGISQMHVSRLLARTLAQLREGLTTED